MSFCFKSMWRCTWQQQQQPPSGRHDIGWIRQPAASNTVPVDPCIRDRSEFKAIITYFYITLTDRQKKIIETNRERHTDTWRQTHIYRYKCRQMDTDRHRDTDQHRHRSYFKSSLFFSLSLSVFLSLSPSLWLSLSASLCLAVSLSLYLSLSKFFLASHISCFLCFHRETFTVSCREFHKQQLFVDIFTSGCNRNLQGRSSSFLHQFSSIIISAYPDC